MSSTNLNTRKKETVFMRLLKWYLPLFLFLVLITIIIKTWLFLIITAPLFLVISFFYAKKDISDLIQEHEEIELYESKREGYNNIVRIELEELVGRELSFSESLLVRKLMENEEKWSDLQTLLIDAHNYGRNVSNST